MDGRPAHRPAAPDAPIPGRHWYRACDPDHPRVTAEGRCEGCGEPACPECGASDYPGHGCSCGELPLLRAKWRAALVREMGGTDTLPEGWSPASLYDLHLMLLDVAVHGNVYSTADGRRLKPNLVNVVAR